MKTCPSPLRTFSFLFLAALSASSSLSAKGVSKCEGLPDQIYLRGKTQSYNQNYSFIIDQGNLCFKENQGTNWRPLTIPTEIQNKVTEISVDDELLAARSVPGTPNWRMTQSLSAPKKFKWEVQRGFPFGKGDPVIIPERARAWAISLISPHTDKYYLDAFGKHTVGVGCTTQVSLHEDGQTYTYDDSWLQNDGSYRMCGPEHGRLIAVALGYSGSGILVMDKYGNAFDQQFDFDIWGSDKIFIPYQWGDRCKGPQCLSFLLGPRQLPTLGWKQLPQILQNPEDQVTNLIAVDKLGLGGRFREYRVEGISVGKTGYFKFIRDFRPDLPPGIEEEQNITASTQWAFIETGAPLLGQILPEARADGHAPDLGGELGQTIELPYVWKSGNGNVSSKIVIEDFSGWCTPSKARVTFANGTRPLELRVHTHESIRIKKINPDVDPIKFPGAFEVPKEIYENLNELPTLHRAFIKNIFKKSRFKKTRFTKTGKNFQIEF